MVGECIRCKGKRIITGKIYNQTDYVSPRSYFRPDGLKFFTNLWSNVRIENKFFSCLDCGFIWSKIDYKQLLKIINESGTPQTKSKLGL